MRHAHLLLVCGRCTDLAHRTALPPCATGPVPVVSDDAEWFDATPAQVISVKWGLLRGPLKVSS
jgi:hypothetical protein